MSLKNGKHEFVLERTSGTTEVCLVLALKWYCLFSFFSFFFSVPEWAERAALAAIDENQTPNVRWHFFIHRSAVFVSAEVGCFCFCFWHFCWWCLPLLKWRDGRIVQV